MCTCIFTYTYMCICIFTHVKELDIHYLSVCFCCVCRAAPTLARRTPMACCIAKLNGCMLHAPTCRVLLSMHLTNVGIHAYTPLHVYCTYVCFYTQFTTHTDICIYVYTHVFMFYIYIYICTYSDYVYMCM